jgi:hypothetical protein
MWEVTELLKKVCFMLLPCKTQSFSSSEKMRLKLKKTVSLTSARHNEKSVQYELRSARFGKMRESKGWHQTGSLPYVLINRFYLDSV